ncbi:MAG: hypothetical protein ACPGYL_11160 [Rhodospirillaceae bacterium]
MIQVDICKWLVVGWLCAVLALVAYRLLRGEIRTDGLLRTHPQAMIDPERIQMLAGTLLSALLYGILALGQIGDETVKSLPEVPDALLVLFSASHSLYLGGKLGRYIFRNPGSFR